MNALNLKCQLNLLSYKRERGCVCVLKMQCSWKFQSQFMLLIPEIYFSNLCQCDHVALWGQI